MGSGEAVGGRLAGGCGRLRAAGRPPDGARAVGRGGRLDAHRRGRYRRGAGRPVCVWAQGREAGRWWAVGRPLAVVWWAVGGTGGSREGGAVRTPSAGGS